MKETIFIAIIASISALLGSLIPTLVSYYNQKVQMKFEFRKTIMEKQKDVYADLMLAFQNVINANGASGMKELQESIVKASIYGDDKSAPALNKYYKELILSTNKKREQLNADEHAKFQKEIINGMRENLGLAPLDYFEIIAYRPN